MRIILVSFIVLLFLFSSVSTALAKTIEIYPAYVDIVLGDKGDEQSFDLFITNKTNKKIKVDFSSLDFKQTDPYGAIGFLGKEIGNYTYSLSSFLTFDNPSLEISSKEKKKLVVTVTNREDLSPGGHYAAVIIRQTPPEDDKNTLVSPALSSLVYLNKKGGERYNLSFKDINFPKLPIVFSYPSTYLITFQNDGNVHLTPYGRADITDIFGRLIYKGIINEGSIKVLPQSRRYIPVYSKKISQPFAISINKLSIEGRDSLDKTKFSYQDYHLYVNPAFIFLLASIIVFLVYKKIRLARKNKASKSRK